MALDTGGWGVTSDYARPGTLCLEVDEGGWIVVHNENPLTVNQLRALSNVLNKAAAELAADLLEES
ncbi:hypothetical protein OG306_33360 [Streptomyces sp. NBC_01241]|uniref:hypothetical protein n=1 Tax=Streptomyces sp. NBC_01241 TaxID=2903794 RepID=UPI00352E3CA4|nr:hypothetical protein OG306_33360 [Streptomyces sp. NBC_01241]